MLQWKLGCMCLVELMFLCSQVNTQKWNSWVPWQFHSSLEELFLFPNGCSKLLSHQQCSRVLSSPQPLQHFLIFDNSHSNRCVVISHYDFDLHFPHNGWCWTSFHVSFGHSYVFFGKCSYSLPVLKLCWFIALLLAALDLRCCPWAFCSCSDLGFLLFAVHGLVIVAASLEEHRL